MTTTDAVNTSALTIFNYSRWQTRLSADSDPPDDDTSVSSVLSAMSASQSAGGQQLDHAQLSWLVSSPLTNRTQPAEFSRMVDVLCPDTKSTRLHLGDYTSEAEAVDASGERLSATSQLRGYHFSTTFPGQWWNDGSPSGENTFETEFAPVFNPIVDGAIRENRTKTVKANKSGYADIDCYLWQHPEAAISTVAKAETTGGDVELWNLKEAVLAMCWHCNLAEPFISNPERTDLSVLDNAPTLENVKLPHGKYLPFYLDRLLQPLGFNWFLDYDTGLAESGDFKGSFADDMEADAEIPSPAQDDEFYSEATGTTWRRNNVDEPTPGTAANTQWIDTGTNDAAIFYNKRKPVIKVFKKGSGTEKQLQFQAPGSTLDLNNSNTNAYSVNRGIGDSVNNVRVLGDVERAEITLELYKGWLATDDTISLADLKKSTGSQYQSKPTVWRLWVANESSDYTDTRTEITAAPDLSTVFSKYYEHRRRLFDPFSYQGEAGAAQRRQIFVEYSTDGGTTWKIPPSEFGQPFVLPDMIGIIWQGDDVPEELYNAGSDAKVRVTGVVEGDARLESRADRQSHAVNGRDVELVLDMPQKFKKHWVQSTGSFASTLGGGAAGAETQDDSTKIEDYAEAVRDDNEVAELAASFTLPGLHLEYQIGDLITEINGREISLDQASGTAPSPRYVQVVAREFGYNNKGPYTKLTVNRGARTPDENGGAE